MEIKRYKIRHKEVDAVTNKIFEVKVCGVLGSTLQLFPPPHVSRTLGDALDPRIILTKNVRVAPSQGGKTFIEILDWNKRHKKTVAPTIHYKSQEIIC